MTPNLGQDACRAIEDAAVLAQCLWVADEADVRESPTPGYARLGLWLRRLQVRAPSVTLR
jgi:2-polyprenyl-6-methoxyphenol hydroxylase-like FAD-dependent oxidoreductase